MKKVMFLSSNRVMVQGFLAALRERPDLNFQCTAMYQYNEAMLDMEASQADIVIVDDTGEKWQERERRLCRRLRTIREPPPACLVLVNQHSSAADRAVQEKQEGWVDDFVFYDSSMDYLLAKLEAL